MTTKRSEGDWKAQEVVVSGRKDCLLSERYWKEVCGNDLSDRWAGGGVVRALS